MAGTVLAWSGSALMLSMSEQRASLRSLNAARAFHLSEAAVDLAVQALRTHPRYTGTTYTGLEHGLGGYAIEVSPLSPSTWRILATGFYPSNDPAAIGYTARTVEAVMHVTKGAGPGYGVLGDRSVRFESDPDEEMRLSSYDSRHGPYSAQGARANVRVCTNEDAEKAISLLGGVSIRGDVVLGPGGDPQTTLWRMPKRWTTISGSVTVADVAAPLEPVEIPALPDGGRLVISGYDVVELPGGLYRFHSVHISGKGRLVFTGPAQVYVENDVEISGNGISTPGDLPTNLAFYVRGSHVSMSGSADLFAKLNAPHATVDISGDGDLYGTVIGREIIVRGHADIHYDEALNTYDEALNPPRKSDPLQVSVLSWREVDP